MRRIILMLVCAVLAIGVVNAQKYNSTSQKIQVIKEKKEKTYYDHGANWFVKAGGGYLSAKYGDYFKYNFQGGYQKQIEKHGLYIGGLIGIQNVEYVYHLANADENSACGAALFIEPMIGIKLKMKENVTLDVYCAGGYGVDLFKGHGQNELGCCGVCEIGLGLWFNRFFIGTSYQGATDWNYAFTINLGFKF